MQNTVQIIPDELGNVIRMSNNPEWGFVRLSQNSFQVNKGFLKAIPLSTLFHGKLDDLRDMGVQNKTELPGKIIVVEQLTPFDTEDPDRDYKMAGKTGIICCVHGEPIYRKTFYTEDVTEQNTLLTHTNGDAIREANNGPVDAKMLKVKTEKKLVTAEEAFDIEEKPTNQVDLEESISVIESEKQEEEVEVLEESTFEL